MDKEHLYQCAVIATLADDKVSESYLMRRCQIGITLAGKLMERMEKEGIVSERDEFHKRTALITLKEWQDKCKTA